MIRMPILCAVATVIFLGTTISLAAEPEPANKQTCTDAPPQTRVPGKRATLKPRKTTPITPPRSVGWDSLDWFVRQQNSDGSWDFNGNFADPGKWKSKTGATAMALLPFLGAGQTHKQGKYKATVDKGIQFLLKQMKNSRGGRDLRGEGGEMIWHGMATTALCEAYAMTHDKSLEDPANKAIRFIRARQDKTTGGWASRKGEKPSMTVTVWQLEALKSSHMAYLKKAYAAMQKASAFLDAVRVDKSFRYGETSPKDADETSTAAGLLCRMWVDSNIPVEVNEEMRQATLYLSQTDSAAAGALYTQFANRVLFRWAYVDRHSPWRKWNSALLKRLTDAQPTDGEEAGSWFDPNDPHAAEGGRLFQTSLNTMVFQCYGHMPTFSDEEEDETEEEPTDSTPAIKPSQGDPFGADPFGASAPDDAPSGGGDPFGDPFDNPATESPAAESPAAEPEPVENDTEPDAPQQSRTLGKRPLLRLRKSKPVAPSRYVVGDSLEWLAKQQNPDGSWDFDGDFPNAGKWKSKTGATGLALLPFLSGNTHKEGKHKAAVNKGIQFLLKQMKTTRKGGDLRGKSGDMVWHAIATLALCEAYAMTHDKSLKMPAQKAIDFICAMQDRRSGGWSRREGGKPSTIVTAWQIKVLVSGHMSYLRVPWNAVSHKTSAYLDSVQHDDGVRYGETSPKDVGNAATAAGLLCRMHTGWKRDNPTLQKGFAYLDKVGPSKKDIVYAYFGKQVMRHWKTRKGLQWYHTQQTLLVDAQISGGDESGSWFDSGDSHAVDGGRLFQTALNSLSVQIYYGRLPIFQDETIEEDSR